MSSQIDFMRLVWKMRRAQKDYFDHQTSGNLANAKRLEAQVDEQLKKAGIESEKIKQMGFELEKPETG